jgi:predicted dienelactone hydrolase
LSLVRAFLVFVGTALLAALPASATGFQYGSAPDPDGEPLELAIWYPSDAPVAAKPVGLFEQDVAFYGSVNGDGLPLIVISHGTGGSAAGHYDTALALADAGFVVVAMSHTGDNYKERAHEFSPRNFADRPRHVSRVIDFMLKSWVGHDHLDPARIGIFGHSAGGATALIAIGGTPDFNLAIKFCADHPGSWDCQRVQERTVTVSASSTDSSAPPMTWIHDPRLKAAVYGVPRTTKSRQTNGMPT